MLQLNLPKKAVGSAHVAIICLLIVLSLIFSFMPIITLDTMEPETALGISKIVNKISDEPIDLSELQQIKISAPKLIKSAMLVSDLMKVAKDKNTLSESKMEALKTKLSSEEGKDTVLTCAAIAHSITSTFKDNMKGNSNIINLIFNVLITVIALFYLLGVTIAMPISFIMLSVKALFPVLKNYKELYLHTASVANKLPEKLSIIMTIMLFQCVIPSMNYGSGTLALWIISVICVFVNFASTRLTAYGKDEFIYLNIVQGASLLSIVGFFVFFFNVLKSNIFSTFTHGSWGMYITKVLMHSNRSEAAKGYIVDAVLILVYLIAVLSSVKFLGKCANRLSCAITAKDGKASLLGNALSLLIVFLMPKIVAARQSELTNPFDKTSKPLGSFLELSKEQTSTLNSVLVGILMMIAAEIALIVLEKKFCKDMSAEAKAAVLSNSATAPETEAAPAEETAEAPTEAATAEESAEAPTEESAEA